jgi:hypothetical protein
VAPGGGDVRGEVERIGELVRERAYLCDTGKELARRDEQTRERSRFAAQRILNLGACFAKTFDRAQGRRPEAGVRLRDQFATPVDLAVGRRPLQPLEVLKAGAEANVARLGPPLIKFSRGRGRRHWRSFNVEQAH